MSKFKAMQPDASHRSKITCPDQSWSRIIECQCTFPPDVFNDVLENLIKNPNITSSHLFRADIYLDTGKNCAGPEDYGHLKLELRPIVSHWPNFGVTRTIVRQLVPRNPNLDKPLVQTCTFLQRLPNPDGVCEDGAEDQVHIVLYAPHVEAPQDVPFYHPAVTELAFVHSWQSTSRGGATHDTGKLAILYKLFPQTTLDNKLERTALRLLETVHKHGQGLFAGYEKRVHLDRLIPQKRYQDTYTILKGRYGKQLSQSWVEDTDPGKHVFEDLAIAAFLIELWRDMYELPVGLTVIKADSSSAQGVRKPAFPGFVDIGCGNGILVHILLSEGYPGWGFDARARKTWASLPQSTQDHLHRRILVPSVLQAAVLGDDLQSGDDVWHDGHFERGEFIVSNHADELTVWTPLLAYLSQTAFMAIPCCSHSLTGARFRAPPKTWNARKGDDKLVRLPQQESGNDMFREPSAPSAIRTQAAETGSLRKSEDQKKLQSAYATLCSYVASLAGEVGFLAEEDVLRIPSTRNQCIVGRTMASPNMTSVDASFRLEQVASIVTTETKADLLHVGAQWIDRARKLMLKPDSGHGH